jgi:hypothetical protein
MSLLTDQVEVGYFWTVQKNRQCNVTRSLSDFKKSITINQRFTFEKIRHGNFTVAEQRVAVGGDN